MPTDPLGWLLRTLALGRAWARLAPAGAAHIPLYVGTVLMVSATFFAWRAVSPLATPDDNPRSVVLSAMVVWWGQQRGWGRRLGGGLGAVRNAAPGAGQAVGDAMSAFVLFVATESGVILAVAGAVLLVVAVGGLIATLTLAWAVLLVVAVGGLIATLTLAWAGQPFGARAAIAAAAGLSAAALTRLSYTRLGQPARPVRPPFFGGPPPLPQQPPGSYSIKAGPPAAPSKATPQPWLAWLPVSSPGAAHYTRQSPGGSMPPPRIGLAGEQYAILRLPGQAWAFRVVEVRLLQPHTSFATASGSKHSVIPHGPVEITVEGHNPIPVDLSEVDAFAQAAHIRPGGRPTPKPAPPPPPAPAPMPDPPPNPEPVPGRVVRVPQGATVTYALLADLAEDDRLALNLLWLTWPLVQPYWPANREGLRQRRAGLVGRLTGEYGLTATAASWALSTWEACL